ncbi:MAG: aspartyl/asparaginyl beta-hydroxylase domain-containing protein [Deltaproteobacteria bacterium]|nr:aspartyl/asparaginyl beta-hydroxylase domain-containing protein [Deltaproteobacteria bacterium]
MERDPRAPARNAPRTEREIDEHLELVPFIDLGLDFDHAALLAEATALLGDFVPYQSDPRYNIRHWRGLALRALDGDPGNAAVAPSAAANQDERYATTPVAARCPLTMALLRDVLDWDACRAVAFLALSPRSRITPHVDDTTHEVMRSVNLALNMPAGCEFVIDCEPDGRPGPFTRTVPLRPGAGMIVNVARPHYVANDSDVTRIHVVARGPARWASARVLELARAQNGHADEASLRAALDARYARLGRPSDHDPEPTRYLRKRKPAPAGSTPGQNPY